MSKTTIIICALLLLLLVQNTWLWLRRAYRRWSARRRGRRAIQGEVDAESLVKKQGYDIIDRQVDTTWTIRVDDEPVEINLRADLVLA